MIEVEKKALYTKDKEELIVKKLIELGAVDLGENNSNSLFYLNDEFHLKVKENLSTSTAKVTWKKGKIGESAAHEEIEFSIDQKDASNVNLVFSKILPQAKVYNVINSRHDFKYKDLEIAIKYSEEWKYHLEIEAMVNNDIQIPEVLEKIQELANILEVKLLTESEEKSFIEELIRKRG